MTLQNLFPMKGKQSTLKISEETFDSIISQYNKYLDKIFGSPALIIDHEMGLRKNNPYLKGISKLGGDIRYSYDEIMCNTEQFEKILDSFEEEKSRIYLVIAQKLLYQYIKIPNFENNSNIDSLRDLYNGILLDRKFTSLSRMNYNSYSKYASHFLGEIASLFDYIEININGKIINRIGCINRLFIKFLYDGLTIDSEVYYDDNTNKLRDCNCNVAAIKSLRSRYNPYTRKHDYYLTNSENITFVQIYDNIKSTNNGYTVFAYREPEKAEMKYRFKHKTHRDPNFGRSFKSNFSIWESKKLFE